MAGVALNTAADREPVLWLPASLTAHFAALAFLSHAPPLALGVWVGLVALSAGDLSMGLRTAWVETPILDHVRIVELQGFVEEVDLRPVGARLVLGVVDAGDMPRDLAPRRVRVTTRKAPGVIAGDYVALQARLAAVARYAALRLRFLPRRLFFWRRRGRLDARRDFRPAAAARSLMGPALSCPITISPTSRATTA
jgi:competence protein ComEC